MDIKEINAKLKSTGIELSNNIVYENLEIIEVSETTDVEGLYTLVIVTLKNKKTDEISKRMIWNLPLRGVTVPIIINNAGINYFLLVSQSRFPFAGKVTIEVNRGFIDKTSNVDEKLFWNYLIDRKVPYLQDYADIIKVVLLGSYLQHTDISIFKMPVQAVFAKTKENYDINELKLNLKVKHDYYNEPKFGPPLHNTQPVLRSFDEINSRLDEIIQNPEASSEEFYLNEVFSITAITLALDYIKTEGDPY